MALKAIKITADNRDMLAGRFQLDPDDKEDMLPLGFWLTTEFGNDAYFDVLTQARFEELFTVTEEVLNGFVAIDAR